MSDRCAPKNFFFTVLEHEKAKQIVDLIICIDAPYEEKHNSGRYEN